MATFLQCDEALSFVELEASSSEEALRQVAARALRAGYVKDTFEEALLKRERSYPTGLPTPIPVAVPHADPEHVITPGISVALLSEPVEFGEMGNGTNTVQVQAIATLLITSPEAHVETLQALVAVFQRPDWYERVSAADTATQLSAIINDLMHASSPAGQ